MKWKLTLAFDGEEFHGWQSQPSGRGVQDRVELALTRLFPCAPVLVSSSRTDAGVHARGLVAHFEVPRGEFRMEPRRLVLAINALLPESIRVRSAMRVGGGFHARFDAIGKEYRYRIWNDPVMNPLLRNQSWHVPRRLDDEAMKRAAAMLEGRHDFRSFTSSRDGVLGDSTRTLSRCRLKRSGPELTIVLDGSGFLYKMCRCIVGTLVQIGEGKIPVESLQDILGAGDRRLAGVNAPACGLILWRVRYPGRGR